MTEEIATPETGAMTEADAVASLMSRNQEPEGKPEVDEEAQAEPAQEPEEPEAEEPQEEAEEATEEPRYRVKVSGEEVEVTLEELLKGYSREGDYQRKTQSLAEEKRAVEAERKRQAEITAQLQAAYESAAQGDDKEPDWEKLAAEADSWEFNQQRVAWETKQKAKAEAARKAQELQAQHLAEVGRVEAEKLKRAVSEWSDPERFAKDYEQIKKVAIADYGYSDAELGKLLDHRALLVLRDAAELRRLRQSKHETDKRVSKAPKVVKPGSPLTKAASAEADVAAHRNRMKKTGKVDDAVAYLLARSK